MTRRELIAGLVAAAALAAVGAWFMAAVGGDLGDVAFAFVACFIFGLLLLEEVHKLVLVGRRPKGRTP